MRLGLSTSLSGLKPREWAEKLQKAGCGSVVFPVDYTAPDELIEEYVREAAAHDLVIAEVGVWRNAIARDAEERRKNLEYSIGQLALADRIKACCCVNVAGSMGERWDGGYRENFTKEAFCEIVKMVKEVIDEVKPHNTYFTIEPMPWMIPDSPESCLQLIRDVDRPRCAVHMDFVNMINCPRRYLAAEEFIEDCFAQLGPLTKSTHIKDSRMNPVALTTMIEECSPGEGCLDFRKVLHILDKYLPADAPVLLEHMTTFEEYAKAYDYLKAIADAEGLTV
jgi:sugar phosphate isomerase/epimerase